jgi:hypothetical protein
VWLFADEPSRSAWAETWAQRTTDSATAEQAIEEGIATREKLAEAAAGWRSWAAQPDAWFSVLHGEVIATA